MDDGPPANDCCSICHGHFKVPCQANCSHWFCGDCIMLVWQHGPPVQPCKCPLCRRTITLLVPGEAGLRERNNVEVTEVLDKVQRYNRIYGGETSGLIQVLSIFLVAVVLHSLFGENIVNLVSWSSRLSNYSLEV
ncbi:E3 ubiquitin-protein ligase RNF170 [Linum perenne]